MMSVQASTPAPDSALHFTIIVIDDDEMTRKIIQKKFIDILEGKECSYSMQFASNGLDGWNLCNRERFSLYVVDKEMPGMDGTEICKKLLEKDPLAQVILYSAAAPEEIARAVLPRKVEIIPKDLKILASSLEGKLVDFKRNSTAGRKNSSNGEKG